VSGLQSKSARCSEKQATVRSASFAAISTLPVILGCALLGATGAKAATCSADPTGCDPYVVTIQQSGPNNVTATGSGEFDLNGLTRTPTNDIGTLFTAQIRPESGLLVLRSGTPGSSATQTYSTRGPGVAGPAFPGQPNNFGTAPENITFTTASGMLANGLGCTSGASCMNSTGPAVAFGQSSNPAFGLAVPTGYMSGNILYHFHNGLNRDLEGKERD
jgi:hypothetical protein